MKVRFVRDFVQDIEVWIDDVKRFTLLKPYTDEYKEFLAVMLEREPDSKEYGKGIVVVDRKFENYESEEAICSIAEELKYRGYRNQVSYLLSENFALEG